MRRPVRHAVTENVLQKGVRTGHGEGYDNEADDMARLGVVGVGALTYVLTLEEKGRFVKSRQVGAYLGLVPRQQQSGERNPQLRITHAGDRYLRTLLVQCAHYIIGPFGKDCRLRQWGLKLAGEGSGNQKKRALAALARKLAVLLHRLWVSGEVYEPFYQRREVALAA